MSALCLTNSSQQLLGKFPLIITHHHHQISPYYACALSKCHSLTRRRRVVFIGVVLRVRRTARRLLLLPGGVILVHVLGRIGSVAGKWVLREGGAFVKCARVSQIPEKSRKYVLQW